MQSKQHVHSIAIKLLLLFQGVKDWHLLLGTGIIVAAIILIVFIGLIVPPFQNNPSLRPDIERPGGVNVSLMIIIRAYNLHVEIIMNLLGAHMSYRYVPSACIIVSYFCMDFVGRFFFFGWVSEN